MSRVCSVEIQIGIEDIFRGEITVPEAPPCEMAPMAFPAEWFGTVGAKISACPSIREKQWPEDCGCLDGFSETLPYCARPREVSPDTEIEIVAAPGWEPRRLKRSELHEKALLTGLRPRWPYAGWNPADRRLPQRPRYGVVRTTYYQSGGAGCTRSTSKPSLEAASNPLLPLKEPGSEGAAGNGCPADFPISLTHLPTEFHVTFQQTGNPPNLYYWPEVETKKFTIDEGLHAQKTSHLGKKELLGQYPALIVGDNLAGDRNTVVHFAKSLEDCLKHGSKAGIRGFAYIPAPGSIAEDRVLRIKNPQGDLIPWRIPAEIAHYHPADVGRLAPMAAIAMKGDKPISFCAEGQPRWAADWATRPNNEAVRWVFELPPRRIEKDR